MGGGAPDIARLVEPGRVHRTLYTDPAVFDLEMSELFGGRWTFLAHESEVPDPGDHVVVPMGRRSIVVARDADGSVGAFYNRCPHRGTVICVEERGHVERFTCPYHGWTFATDGRLLAAPHADDDPSFEPARFGLPRVARVEAHRGFVFATTTSDAPPLSAHLAGVVTWLDAFIDRAPGGRLSVLPGTRRVSVAGNWKLLTDNAADPLHPTTVHASYNELGRVGSETSTVLSRDPATTPMVVHAWPAGHVVVDQRPGFAPPYWATQKRATGVEAAEASLRARYGDARTAELLEQATGALMNLAVFPNLLIYGNQLVVLEPQAPDRTTYRLVNTVADDLPEELSVLRLRIEEDFSVFGVPDDDEMYARTQRGLEEALEVEWVDMSRGAGTAGDEPVTVHGITSELPARVWWSAYRRALTP